MSKEDLKNVTAVEEDAQTEESTEVKTQVTEEPKATKLEVAKVFLKNNWKKIALGAVLTAAVGYVATRKPKDDDDEDAIEGDWIDVEGSDDETNLDE